MKIENLVRGNGLFGEITRLKQQKTMWNQATFISKIELMTTMTVAHELVDFDVIRNLYITEIDKKISQYEKELEDL